jgi:Fe-S oxidoreductase
VNPDRPRVNEGTRTDVLALDVLLYDGTRMPVGKHGEEEVESIIRDGGRRGEVYAKLRAFRDKYADLIRAKFPHIPRRVSGYNLPWLLPENGFDVAKALVGSEGTLVMILEATVRLVWSPPARSLLVLGYPDVDHAADHIPEVLEAGPVGPEGMDDRLVHDMKAMHIHPETLTLLPEGGGWLLVEFGAESKAEADAQARKLMDRLKNMGDAPTMKLYDNPADETKIWTVRRSGLGATAHVPGKKITWEGWEDASVPPEKLGGYLRDFRKLLDKYDYEGDLYGHFGQGCVHTRIDFDLETAEGIKTFRTFLDEAADLVVSYGGSLSGEHGDGQSKAAMLPKMYGDEMIRAFEEFKTIWDPAWKMNPGKVVKPYDPAQNLRLGTHYDPPDVRTHFRFPADRDEFGRVTLRCVGVGECRRAEGGTMCPSYRVTHEEMHSTRGRAHLLFEMLQGNPLGGGWKSDPVREALDLCLACKGCKQDCPVNVDMATYKAEFLSHYYEGRPRPRHAYAMGLIYWWARLASIAPGLANFLGQSPVLRDVVKWLGGIAPERRMPAFAPETFKAWFLRRGPHNRDYPPVILWPDTFNNHFHPDVAKAAVEVLEAAGFQVLVPAPSLCCGRPLYDFGMLHTAKRLLRQILDTLKPWIEAGVPVVGLEPSCLAVFRDELTGLFPDDEDARRLNRQSFLLSEFLNRQVKDYQPPQFRRKALVHAHCHHKAVMKTTDEEAILKKLGLDYHLLDSGCCGMAGSFGFERQHYHVSRAVGELVLLPAVREAARDTLVITNGFSCHEQIEQCTDRRPVHLAQVLRMALRQGAEGTAAGRPDDVMPPIRTPSRNGYRSAVGPALLVGGGAVLGGLLVWGLTRRRR